MKSVNVNVKAMDTMEAMEVMEAIVPDTKGLVKHQIVKHQKFRLSLVKRSPVQFQVRVQHVLEGLVRLVCITER